MAVDMNIVKKIEEEIAEEAKRSALRIKEQNKEVDENDNDEH